MIFMMRFFLCYRLIAGHFCENSMTFTQGACHTAAYDRSLWRAYLVFNVHLAPTILLSSRWR